MRSQVVVQDVGVAGERDRQPRCVDSARQAASSVGGVAFELVACDAGGLEWVTGVLAPVNRDQVLPQLELQERVDLREELR
ncbi:MAG: hypothetical protein QOK11_2726 [Pseudonocardiales bacterium]|nr:hypothetical protein [Pseudonocardiales bacterium]